MTVLPSRDEPLDLRLALPALAAWVVAWQGRLLPPRVLLCAAALAGTTAALLLLRRPSGRTLVAAAVLGCSAASGLVTGAHAAARTTGPLARAAGAESAVTVEGALTDDPRLAAGPRVGPVARDLVVVRLRVEVLRVAGRTYRMHSPVVVLSSERAWLVLLPSQHVRAEGRLRPPERGDDVAAVLSGRGPPLLLSRPSAVQRVAGHLRAGLRRAVAPLPDAERGLLPGLVVGDTSRLSPQVREDFRTVGLTHLTAVSGTNVAVRRARGQMWTASVSSCVRRPVPRS